MTDGIFSTIGEKFSGIGDGFNYLLIGVIIAILISTIIFLIFYIKSFNIRVMVIDKRKGTNKIIFDKAKKIKQDNVFKLKLMRTKSDPLKLPLSRNIYNWKGKDFLLVKRTFDGTITYLEEEDKEDIELLRENNPDSRFWETLTIRKISERYGIKTFWEKWGSLIINGIYALLLFFLIIFLFKELEGIAVALNNVAGAIGSACSNNIPEATIR